jgi:hypothetical protein
MRLAGRAPEGAGTKRLFERAVAKLPDGARTRALGGDVDAALAVVDDWPAAA